MANEGIFLTKPGITLPVVTEMSLSAWQGYGSNLTLALIKNTDHEFSVFEAFKFRAGIVDNVNANVLFNNKTNYTPTYLTGTGSLNTSTGLITPSSVPLTVEESNKVFLSGSNLQVTQIGNDDELTLRIAAINGLSHILGNTKTGLVTITKDGSSPTTDANAVLLAQVYHINVDDDAIEVVGATFGVLYSQARTYTAKVTSGAIGVLASSGTATGDATPFDTTETFESADSVVNGVLTVESNFGQLTTYTVKLGTSMLAAEGAGPGGANLIEFTAGQSGSHAVTDELTGGVGTKSYSVSSGSLPSGMNLTSGGVIQGVPVTDGESSIIVSVTDEFGTTQFVEYVITVKQSANVSYNPTSAIRDAAYSFNPNFEGITAAELTAGALPTGVSLNEDDGSLSGTPTAAGTFTFTLLLTFGTITETVEVSMVVYVPMTAELFTNGSSDGLLENNDSPEVHLSDAIHVEVGSGSGHYQYSITGDNTIDSNGNVTLYQSGTVQVTVTDSVTGEQISFSFLVAGQADICGLAVVEEATGDTVNAPCTDVITDCNTPVTVAFNSLQVLKGIEAGGVPSREYVNFVREESGLVQNNGKAFTYFKTTSANGFGIADNLQDGNPALVEFVVNSTLANSPWSFWIGVANRYTGGGEDALDYSLKISTVDEVRSVEILDNGLYQAGSRFAILEGQQVGVGFFGDSLYLYIDGIKKFTLASNTFLCSGLELVFIGEIANMYIGGRATNLEWEIETDGTADEVGTIDIQTGFYTPSRNNVGVVTVLGRNTMNNEVVYRSRIRVIKAAMKENLEKALLMGVPVNAWICDTERFDDLALRLDSKGHPDRNQVSHPDWLGDFLGSGKIEPTLTKTAFNSDVGSLGSNLRIDMYTFTGSAIAIRNFNILKRVLQFVVETQEHSARVLTQYATGCLKRIRLILVFRSPDCGDIPTYDAIEFGNCISYTPFNPEVGSTVQAVLPLSIECYPDADGRIWRYYQFDKAWNRIASGTP
jgi:hypothetical protein